MVVQRADRTSRALAADAAIVYRMVTDKLCSALSTSQLHSSRVVRDGFLQEVMGRGNEHATASTIDISLMLGALRVPWLVARVRALPITRHLHAYVARRLPHARVHLINVGFLSSTPGTPHQPWHTDVPAPDGSHVYTMLLAVSRQRVEDGPTVFAVGSSASCKQGPDNFVVEQIIFDRGEGAMMRGDVWHHAGACTFDKTDSAAYRQRPPHRVLLYGTFHVVAPPARAVETDPTYERLTNKDGLQSVFRLVPHELTPEFVWVTDVHSRRKQLQWDAGHK